MDVLIVDDSKAMRMIIRRTLRKAGYEHWKVHEAKDGQEALQKIREDHYGLVFLDWNMPNMTGIELMEILQKERPTLRCGFVTTEGSEETRQRAADAGAKFLLAKPFTEESLQESLKLI